MIHEYAVVDNTTEQVIGKYVGVVKPPKMQNIPYKLVKTTNTGTTMQTGTAFLSKAQKFWNEVSDPLYLVSPEQLRTTLKLEGFV
ncbi:hypothetical protein DQT32_04145 [Salmonella enterica subsp. enterica serovar Braenderup]|nr:hypothetical protein [Salmonella enterica subsp. enterica serovar Braenderup]